MQPNESQPLMTRSAEVVVFDDARRIPSAAVRTICGGISYMTLWRWLNDPAMAFPKPIKLGARRYWRQSEVVAWLEAREVAA